MSESAISQNLALIKEKIAEAEKKSGRAAGSVKLCAVSKFHPADSVIEALRAGQFLFGENRVQEACEKFTFIREHSRELKLPQANLHIIGSLQSNKVKKAVEAASCIQSVDRLSLLEEIEKRAAQINKNIEVYFEIHTGEESKSGYADETSFFQSLERVSKKDFPHIVPKGLMTMAPFTQDKSLIHKSFSSLRTLLEKCQKEFPDAGLTELSMGMSGDFEIAIEEGSTLVRVGTAIFGERNYQEKAL